MSSKKNVFRTILDAMIESRTREAERHLAEYRNTVDTFATHYNKR